MPKSLDEPNLQRKPGHDLSLSGAQIPTEQGDTQLARQGVYSEFGERAFAAGQRAVYLGSKPYQAWLSYRGKDGMPGFVDRAIINGKVQEIVWMPSLYPPRRSADESERDGGWSNL